LLSLSLSCERASWQVCQTCKPTNSGVQDVYASEETLPLSFVHTLACGLRPAPDAATRVARPEKREAGMHLNGTLVLLLKGAIYFETRKHYLVVKCTRKIFFLSPRKAEFPLPIHSSLLWKTGLAKGIVPCAVKKPRSNYNSILTIV
jgi:hypothetical protein